MFNRFKTTVRSIMLGAILTLGACGAATAQLETTAKDYSFDLSTERKVCQYMSNDFVEMYDMWDSGMPIEVIRTFMVLASDRDPIIKYPLDILVDVLGFFEPGELSFMQWLIAAEEVCVDVIGPDYMEPEAIDFRGA